MALLGLKAKRIWLWIFNILTLHSQNSTLQGNSPCSTFITECGSFFSGTSVYTALEREST